jgi:hypothetical protein
MPATGAGISTSTLSVVTSTSGWSASTRSPSFTSQREIVPSATLSPSAGSSTAIDIPGLPGAADLAALVTSDSTVRIGSDTRSLDDARRAAEADSRVGRRAASRRRAKAGLRTG